jgi:peroxiredoxin family protein
MPPDSDAPPTKLSLIVFSDGYERVHYALALASSALAIGRQATLFFTMGGIRALIRADEDGMLGWRSLPGAERDEDFAAEGLATFEELLAACMSLGAKMLVCEMGLKAEGLTADDLRPDVTIVQGGIVTFLNDARADGAMLMI